MAIRREQPKRHKKIQAEGASDDNLRAASPAAPPEGIDILRSLSEFAADPRRGSVSPPHGPQPSQQRLSRLQKVLLVCIAFVAGIFAYTMFRKFVPAPAAGVTEPSGPAPAAATVADDPVLPEPVVTSTEPSDLQAIEQSLARPEPLSLRVAEKFRLAGDVENALATYDKLYRRLPGTEQNQPLRDFLLLQMALCSKSTGNMQQADNMLRAVALSRLPVLRALARYHQCLTLIDRERYLEAAEKAYQTVGLIEAVDYDTKWASAVQQQCCFLVAEALTRHLLTLRDADINLPEALWNRHPEINPFVNLDEAQLKVLLSSGREKMDDALLSPQIHPVGETGTTRRWSVTCNGASVDELLARFASNAGLDVHWTDNGRATPDEEACRRRPVCLHMTHATAQQVITVSAGSVGLLARIDEQGNVRVLDPSSYTSLAEHTQILATELVSLWQQFLLGAEADEWIAPGHCALALVHVARDRLDEAIAEYRLVANRFPKHALAPHALLQSGKLKVKLRDYVGAHEDLKQLIELYPDTPLSDQACLYLADATMKAGLYDEATGLYRKVFNLGLSLESQTASALGAGRCFYETQDYEAAAQWLNRYVTLALDQDSREFRGACLLLGKTYLAMNNLEQAQAALNAALRGELSRQQHMDTVVTLLKTYMQQGLFIEALNLLEETQAWQLSQREAVELLLLRAEALRAIGLVEKAGAILADRGAFLPDPELKGRVALELARCYADNGDRGLAIETLGKAFALVEPGPLARQIGCELAQLCLQADQSEQAISVLSQLLDHTTGTDRERVLKLQADAYRRVRQYNDAVAVLLSRYVDSGQPESPGPRVRVQERQ